MRWRRTRRATYSPSGRPTRPRSQRPKGPCSCRAMEELLKQFWPDLIGRVHGPLEFRLVLQPLTAALIACRAGLRDARSGRPAYGWAILTNPIDRHDLLREGWRELTRVFIVAVIVDLFSESVA